VLKTHYDEFFNTLQMMRSEIGIKCPAKAALLGRQLHEMGADFEQELALIATRHKARARDIPKMPTTFELLKLIQVSFFKLVDPKVEPPDDKGWFSGHPFEWEKTYKKIQQVYKSPASSPPLSTMLQALLNLFNSGDGPQTSITYISGFPYKSLPSWTWNKYPYVNDGHDEDDDEDDNDFDHYADED
jgi:hypothetical protein